MLRKCIFFTIFFFFLIFFADNVRSSSLSELNYDYGESSFFKGLPWSEKDPFIHPSYEVKEIKDEHDDGKDTVEASKIIEELTPPKLNLSAILFSTESKSAIIDGQIVKVGSIISEHKILEINKDSIKVDFNGREYELKLNNFLKLTNEK